MDKSESKLLPCPFCGSAASVENDFGRTFWVQCNDLESCGATDGMEWTTPAEAIAAWNRRAPTSADSAQERESELPPLPLPEDGTKFGMPRFYTSDDMRNYARSALAAHAHIPLQVADEGDMAVYQSIADNYARKSDCVWKVTYLDGSSCHFGVKSTAIASARGTGTIEEIKLKDRDHLKLVASDGAAPAPMSALTDQHIAGLAVLKGYMRTEMHGKRIIEFDAETLIDFARAVLAAAQGEKK